ncbi:hypothetical protein [Paraburkholderia phosphatilytica]|uniref:hypothetical protein n=1 Tax=Paraburkholderia phosphatilytica TaxID=2282883 RepID=UPI000E5487D3|nr:hypothetical protein [Paraburkholderia phosphatilytica]
MKSCRQALPVLLISLLCASGSAFAQGNGGGGTGGAAGAGGGSQDTQNAADATMGASHAKASHKKIMHHKKATKPATDTTNMPGADASSDTKGK